MECTSENSDRIILNEEEYENFLNINNDKTLELSDFMREAARRLDQDGF